MTSVAFLLLLLVVGPAVCALIAHARGIEWWVGALLGVTGCVGLVIVCVMKPGQGGGRNLAPPAPNSQWVPDPTGRHELRLWDGRSWSANVSDQGRSGWDPLQ